MRGSNTAHNSSVFSAELSPARLAFVSCSTVSLKTYYTLYPVIYVLSLCLGGCEMYICSFVFYFCFNTMSAVQPFQDFVLAFLINRTIEIVFPCSFLFCIIQTRTLPAGLVWFFGVVFGFYFVFCFVCVCVCVVFFFSFFLFCFVVLIFFFGGGSVLFFSFVFFLLSVTKSLSSDQYTGLWWITSVEIEIIFLLIWKDYTLISECSGSCLLLHKLSSVCSALLLPGSQLTGS